MSHKPEPAIWWRDTGQTYDVNQDLVLAEVWPLRRRWVHAPAIHVASHVDHEKSVARMGFLFLCMHEVLFL